MQSGSVLHKFLRQVLPPSWRQKNKPSMEGSNTDIVRVTARVEALNELVDKKVSNFIFQLNTCGYSPYVTSSLTRGWVCRLQLLLVLSSAVILGSELYSWPHFTVSRFEIYPTWRVRSPYFYPPGTEWPGYNPRQGVPFSSPPMTHRATVEVFDRASTRESWSQLSLCPAYNSSARTTVENTVSDSTSIAVFSLLGRRSSNHFRGIVFCLRSELPSNGSDIFPCLTVVA
jgi:hypothetical protein